LIIIYINAGLDLTIPSLTINLRIKPKNMRTVRPKDDNTVIIGK
jgi:hypothetical protein